MPLADYKRQLARQVIQQGIATAKFDVRELIWAVADHAVAGNVIPDAYRDEIISAEQGIISAIGSKVQSIQEATTHADAEAAYNA